MIRQTTQGERIAQGLEVGRKRHLTRLRDRKISSKGRIACGVAAAGIVLMLAGTVSGVDFLWLIGVVVTLGGCAGILRDLRTPPGETS